MFRKMKLCSSQQVVIAVNTVLAILQTVSAYSCSNDQHPCSASIFSSRLKCVGRNQFCDGVRDCSNSFDEIFCNDTLTRNHFGCPRYWFECKDGRCLPSQWKCDGLLDCQDHSDEAGCVYTREVMASLATTTTARPLISPSNLEEVPGMNAAKANLQKWLLGRRKNETTTNKWGHHLARTAVALYLSGKQLLTPGKRTFEEMSYELTVQLLSRLSEESKLDNNDLALYIHALLVTCIDPRNFYGYDLLSQLRAHVDGCNHTVSPFEFLVLCNAGDTMTSKDVKKITEAYDSQHRPFWTDNQAMATLALACISARSDVYVYKLTLSEMSQKLKKRQFKNGTVENIKTTGLVLQALLATDSYKRDFDFEAAIKMIIKSQKPDGSIGTFFDSYYVLPALSNTSLLSISSKHCKRPTSNEEDALNELQRIRGERVTIQYSIWVGNDAELKRTLSLKVPFNSTLYDIIELAYQLDPRQQVVYNVIYGKPYVSSLTGLDDDVETSRYWFIYLKTPRKEVQLVEESPVDVKVLPGQELILWYKNGKWIKPSLSSNQAFPVTESGSGYVESVDYSWDINDYSF